MGCNRKPAKTPGFDFGLEKAISLSAVAILKAKNGEQSEKGRTKGAQSDDQKN